MTPKELVEAHIAQENEAELLFRPLHPTTLHWLEEELWQVKKEMGDDVFDKWRPTWDALRALEMGRPYVPMSEWRLKNLHGHP